MPDAILLCSIHFLTVMVNILSIELFLAKQIFLHQSWIYHLLVATRSHLFVVKAQAKCFSCRYVNSLLIHIYQNCTLNENTKNSYSLSLFKNSYLVLDLIVRHLRDGDFDSFLLDWMLVRNRIFWYLFRRPSNVRFLPIPTSWARWKLFWIPNHDGDQISVRKTKSTNQRPS